MERMLTKLDNKRAHGEPDTFGKTLVVIGGGIRLQSRYERLNVSQTARGISSSYDGMETEGRLSTIACMAV